MNSKKEKFIKYDETVINGKKRNVYKKNSLNSKTLYIRSNNEYKKIKIKGGGFLDFFKKRLGFSVDKIDLFTKEDYDNYNILVANSNNDEDIYKKINDTNFNRYSSNYQIMYICNKYFLKLLKEEHFNQFRYKFMFHPEIKKFLDKCHENLKAFILELLNFENFKNIDFDFNDELKLFRLLFFIKYMYSTFNQYLNNERMPEFKKYFENKLPKDFIESYWDTDKLLKDDSRLNLLMVKNYDEQRNLYDNNQKLFVKLMTRKYSNIKEASKYSDLIEYTEKIQTEPTEQKLENGGNKNKSKLRK